VAQSGSGKSENQKPVIYDLEWRSRKKRNISISIMEPHGDLAQEVLFFNLHKGKNRSRIIYINPTINKLLNTKDTYSPIINPFDIEAKDEDTIDAFAQEITNALKEMLKSGNSAGGLTRNMDAIIKPCVATLLRKEGSDLSDLKRFMSKNNEDLIKLGMQSPDAEHADFFEHGFQNEQYNITKNSLYIKLQSLLNSPVFRRLVIGKSTINLQKAFNSGKLIIFDVAKSRGRTMAADF